jgi:phage shock protein A
LRIVPSIVPPRCFGFFASPNAGALKSFAKGEIMALLDRVSTLIRANLNDLIDRAENPGKLIKQVLLDMENQLLQLKTQVAVSIADQHMLEKKQKENEMAAADWLRKAERAVDKLQDDLARAGLERHRSYHQLSESYQEQVEDQKVQVETLKSALRKLDQKLTEAKSKKEMLIARHRRSFVASRANRAEQAIGDRSKIATFDRLKDKVLLSEAVSQAETEMLAEDLGDKLAKMEREDEIDRMLAEMKTRRGLAN